MFVDEFSGINKNQYYWLRAIGTNQTRLYFKIEKVGSVRNTIFENGNRSYFLTFKRMFPLTRTDHG